MFIVLSLEKKVYFLVPEKTILFSIIKVFLTACKQTRIKRNENNFFHFLMVDTMIRTYDTI